MIRSGLLWLALLGACGDLTALDGQPARPALLPPSMPAGLAGAVPEPRPAGPRRADPVPNVTPYAAEAQLRRIDDLSTGIAALPAGTAASAADLEELRRQRQQAQAIAGSRPLSRPALGRTGAPPDFAPVATADPLLLGIQRATAAETRATFP